MQREYKEGMVDTAIRKARAVPRLETIKKKAAHLKHTRRPVFAVTWDPRLPIIPSIQLKHWRSMCLDPKLAEVFKEPPLTAFKRQKKRQGPLNKSQITTSSRPTPKKTNKWCEKVWQIMC